MAFFIASCLAGCSPEAAKKLEYGRPRSDFGFLLTLNPPLTVDELQPIVANLAADVGYSIEAETARPRPEIFNESRVGFSWREFDSYLKGYRISVTAMPSGASARSELYVIVIAPYGVNFGKDDWLSFREWRDVRLPTMFPDAIIETVRHPVRYTPKDLRTQLAKETGVDLPPRYRESRQ